MKVVECFTHNNFNDNSCPKKNARSIVEIYTNKGKIDYAYLRYYSLFFFYQPATLRVVIYNRKEGGFDIFVVAEN